MRAMTVLMLILIVVVGGFTIVRGVIDLQHPIYTGKEVFYTETEYLDFKKACASENVSIRKLEVLASEPPIIVNFELTATRDFPYGTTDALYPKILIIVGLGILIVAPLCLLISVRKERGKTEE